jgi:hypothetical protein
VNRDDIIKWAREAGCVDPMVFLASYERFAALVAAAEREACKQWFIEDSERFAAQVALAEREACADICDQHATCEGTAQLCAAAIRARGQA